ncbi:hypothetical protein LTR08_002028 [Meristemomyces frigidus]|nr:hypothetical protein LTR08_002028 [Meristemomyces frigidus]
MVTTYATRKTRNSSSTLQQQTSLIPSSAKGSMGHSSDGGNTEKKVYKYRGGSYEIIGDEEPEWLESGGQVQEDKRKRRRTAERLDLREGSVTTDSTASDHQLDQLEPEICFVEKILAEDYNYNNSGKLYYLLKWVPYQLHSATWEPLEHILEHISIELWEQEKILVQEGKVKPFDIAEFNSASTKYWDEQVDCHERKRKRRRMRGLSVSPDDERYWIADRRMLRKQRLEWERDENHKNEAEKDTKVEVDIDPDNKPHNDPHPNANALHTAPPPTPCIHRRSPPPQQTGRPLPNLMATNQHDANLLPNFATPSKLDTEELA